jgi:hypothetical protein
MIPALSELLIIAVDSSKFTVDLLKFTFTFIEVHNFFADVHHFSGRRAAKSKQIKKPLSKNKDSRKIAAAGLHF